MAEFRMPSLGADMESGRIVEWLVKPGDAVKRGDIVAVVETQKGTIDVETFSAGVVDRLVVPVGDEVPVGTVLALIDGTGALPPTTTPAPAAQTPTASPAARPAAIEGAQAEPAAATGRARVSPAARRLAEKLGVDLSTLHGTGPGSAIGIVDVQAATQPVSPAAAVRSPVDAQAAMRTAIAAAMARSKREIPHYYLASDIDMQPALTWLEEQNSGKPITERVLYAAVLLKASALAVRQVPELNGFWLDGAFRPSAAVNLGVAISLPHGGLVAPAIHDADKLPVDDLMAAFRDLVTRARSGRLRSSELSDPTITVTSLGEQSASTVFGVIYPPQVAIVGFGSIGQRPWVIDGNVLARPVVTATLAADHRASVGHRGAVFLTALSRLLKEPGQL